MKLELFESTCLGFSKQSNVNVSFSVDEHGMFMAKFSDGTIITGNSVSNKLTVKSGSYHLYQIAV